jgi:hypothetical protein
MRDERKTLDVALPHNDANGASESTSEGASTTPDQIERHSELIQRQAISQFDGSSKVKVVEDS